MSRLKSCRLSVVGYQVLRRYIGVKLASWFSSDISDKKLITDNRQLTTVLTTFIALLLSACSFDSVPQEDAGSVFGGRERVVDSLAAGLYRESEGGVTAMAGAPDAGDAGFLAAAFTYLVSAAESGGAYRIVLGADEVQRQKLLYPGTFGGATGVSLTLTGSGAERTIALEDTGNLYAVREGVKLILGAGITLRGSSGNIQPMVLVENGGELWMEEGALVTGDRKSVV